MSWAKRACSWRSSAWSVPSRTGAPRFSLSIYRRRRSAMPKTGVDDFLAAGHNVAELKMLARKFEPSNVVRVRMSRDDTLRALVEDLERRHSEADWTAPGGDADEDLYLALRARARKHGTPHPDGIRVTGSWGSLGFEAKISSS